ncbi:MAG: spheroidene monooxygenase, partial [Roseovarius sp.]|nr:spheroidene monooxygenase [Roseovarius sp.]
MQTVSLSFFRFSPGFDRLWALTMMGAARLSMGRIPGIGFWKLLGSGTGEGFTPIPNTGVYAILA